MSSYLDIAEQVLTLRKRPMGPHAILKDAYLLDLMPSHLHGETQHKTLQARLSEDILHLRDRSRFIRTEPGKFFLRSFLADESIPSEFRTPMTARRRKRELTPDPVLCIAKGSLEKLSFGVENCADSIFENLRATGELTYYEVKKTPDGHVPLWCFVLFVRGESVLSYRVGRYRTNDDDPTAKRTIGFTTLVTEDQQTLFNHFDLGVVEAGVSALAMDLDFPMEAEILETETSEVSTVVEITGGSGVEAALLVIETVCPSWFEPTAKRLSMNDMQWVPFHVPPNHLDDFDLWTRPLCARGFSAMSSPDVARLY